MPGWGEDGQPVSLGQDGGHHQPPPLSTPECADLNLRASRLHSVSSGSGSCGQPLDPPVLSVLWLSLSLHRPPPVPSLGAPISLSECVSLSLYSYVCFFTTLSHLLCVCPRPPSSAFLSFSVSPSLSFSHVSLTLSLPLSHLSFSLFLISLSVSSLPLHQSSFVSCCCSFSLPLISLFLPLTPRQLT